MGSINGSQILARALRKHGVDAVYPLTDLEPDPARSTARAAELLEATAERIAADRLRSRPERTP